MSGGNEFSFLSCKRRIVNTEINCNGGLGDLLERNGIYRGGAADGITDMDLGNTGYSNDRSDLSFGNLNLCKSVKLIELADLGLD